MNEQVDITSITIERKLYLSYGLKEAGYSNCQAVRSEVCSARLGVTSLGKLSRSSRQNRVDDLRAKQRQNGGGESNRTVIAVSSRWHLWSQYTSDMRAFDMDRAVRNITQPLASGSNRLY